MWQDLIYAVGSTIFGIGLLPTIFGKFKPSFYTAIAYVIVLTAFALSDWSLHLTFGAIFTGILAIEWLVVGVQAWRLNRPVIQQDE